MKCLEQHGYHRQGSCQAGFSAAISKVSRKLLILETGSFFSKLAFVNFIY